MSVAFVKALPHTVRDCPSGCDLKTVQVDPGFGDPVWVHAGTYEYRCPRTAHNERSRHA
ncbi:hypothetical protein SK854_30150 [Lentzea sp. BCCO 10_0061]|uniref:Uncharacterized protein n=1 Tax=Lentzea sokolovensis TaxID=3095429 RepID=A0ABU4V3N4_9PSEU|nr:hypothetical protein [Lentzea sp. BCCO 10_0061]MDX8146410.1 hypothetical protein [Lentzea sp. BCCO 10_0061]